MKLRKLKFALIIAAGLLCEKEAWADTPVPTPAANRPRNIRFDLPSFFETVRPMRHPLNGRMPILLWSLPMPTDMQLIMSRRSGALRKAIDELELRGITPTVPAVGEGAVALALTLQDAGQPTYLLLAHGTLIESTAWQNCPVWVETPDPGRRGGVRKWPCLPLADPKPGARQVERWLKPFHEAGVRVAAVCFDDEGLPQAWGPALQSQRTSEECRRQYPPGVMDDPKRLQDFLAELRVTLTRQIMTEPAHRFFPGCWVGNFGDSPSDAENPFIDPNGNRYPFCGCGGDAAMPGLYANNVILPPPGADGSVIKQETADAIYFNNLFRNLTWSAANTKAAGKRFVPYISQAVFDNPNPRARVGLGNGRWKEFQYHLWLRGAQGIFIFNLGFDQSKLSANFSFKSVEMAREIYDELLEYREFLDRGEPMNLKMPDLNHGEPGWSGLRLPGRYLIRAFSPTSLTQQVEVLLEKGIKIKLDAPAQGATYLVGQDGQIVK